MDASHAVLGPLQRCHTKKSPPTFIELHKKHSTSPAATSLTSRCGFLQYVPRISYHYISTLPNQNSYPVSSVINSPSPPNTTFLNPGMVCTSYCTEVENATTLPELTRRVSPSLSSRWISGPLKACFWMGWEGSGGGGGRRGMLSE